jgi:hypothetical protein
MKLNIIIRLLELIIFYKKIKENIKWILGQAILSAEMVVTKSIHRFWKWTRDYLIMTPLKTVLKKIIIQILITKLNIDKNLGIIRNRMIMRAIVLQTWGTPKEKLINLGIMVKGWTLRIVNQEKASTDLKIKNNMAAKIYKKMKVSIKMCHRIQKITINFKT